MPSLESRLYHNPGPKRILALDGGGIRGALTLGYLEKIESLLQDRYQNPNFRLCDYFDLIVGTSTGAIIAAGLAMGMSSKEIKAKYLDLGADIFSIRNGKWIPSKIRPLFIKANYDHHPLEKHLQTIFGNTLMGDQEKIRTGLCIVTKRVDTFSTWPIHNLPRGIYYQRNKDILIRDILRASSAAPSYFLPQELPLGNGVNGHFIDGGVSLANNPGFQALLVATLKGFTLEWPLGDKNLFIVSIGSGTSPKYLLSNEVKKMKIVGWATKIPDLFMEDASYFNQSLLQLLSKSETAQSIDSEIGDLKEDSILGKKPLTYTRYNIHLEQQALLSVCGRPYSYAEVDSLREMDHAQNRHELARIGGQAANQQVKPEHFPEDFDPGYQPKDQLLHLTAGKIPTYPFQSVVKKPIPVQAYQMKQDFEVETMEGTLRGKAGDYLMVGVQGEMYPISKAVFERTYEGVS